MTQGILKKLETSIRNTYLDDLEMKRYYGSIRIQIRAYGEGQNLLGAGIGKPGNHRSEKFFRVFRSPYYCRTKTRTYCSFAIRIKAKRRNGNEKSRMFWKITLNIDVTGIGNDINDFLEQERSKLYENVCSIFSKKNFDVYLDDSKREVEFNEKFKRKVV